jgi:predicted SprT family Zn-dependent metalloprotease
LAKELNISVFSSKSKKEFIMSTIEGNPIHIPDAIFRPKIQKCLDLLKEKAGAYGTWFDSFNLKIRAARASGANYTDNTIDIAPKTFAASETWVASVIIHESVHFWQFRSGKFPTGPDAEKEAMRLQLCVLNLVGAPKSEITHLQSQNGKHADRDGDGVYTQKDYEKRDY